MVAAAGPDGTGLAELHVHVGGAVDPPIMWGIAHSQGIRLPTKNYWDFESLITFRGRKPRSFDDYLRTFDWTEMIQSSPSAMERAVYEIIGGAYRKNNITLLELRFNPMKRNRGGERDLDHIIMGAIHGMDRALLEYPVSAGLIFCLDKSFDYRLNEIIAKKALTYRRRGIVGIDIAGPKGTDFRFRDCATLFDEGRKSGLGLTVHVGETDTYETIEEVLTFLKPNRIGHGLSAVENKQLLEKLAKNETLLEICPTSNLLTGVVSSVDELRRIIHTFKEHGVKFCLNTDGPEMLLTNLKGEILLMRNKGILTDKDIELCNEWATDASFVAKS